MPETLEQMAERYERGDDSAYGQIWEKMGPALEGHIINLYSGKKEPKSKFRRFPIWGHKPPAHMEPHDVAADAFAHAMEAVRGGSWKKDKKTGVKRFAPWLWRVVDQYYINLCLKRTECQVFPPQEGKKPPPRLDDDVMRPTHRHKPDPTHASTPAVGPADIIRAAAMEYLYKIRNANHQLVLFMTAPLGTVLEDVAEILGRPLGTVKNDNSRARDSLAKRFHANKVQVKAINDYLRDKISVTENHLERVGNLRQRKALRLFLIERLRPADVANEMGIGYAACLDLLKKGSMALCTSRVVRGRPRKTTAKDLAILLAELYKPPK